MAACVCRTGHWHNSSRMPRSHDRVQREQSVPAPSGVLSTTIIGLARTWHWRRTGRIHACTTPRSWPHHLHPRSGRAASQVRTPSGLSKESVCAELRDFSLFKVHLPLRLKPTWRGRHAITGPDQHPAMVTTKTTGTVGNL